MAPEYKIAAAVLIGGRSRRMGSPKEDVVIPGDGRTFLDRICDEVDACFGEYLCERYLSVRKGQKRIREGYTLVEDEYDDIGPLGGLASVLKRASDDGCHAVLLLACDMICYTRNEIANICNRYTGQDILIARTDKSVIQPLASIYSVGMTGRVITQVGSGDYRLRKLADGMENISFYDPLSSDIYRNVNEMQFIRG